MKKILTTLYKDNGFDMEHNLSDEVMFHKKQDQEYFITVSYTLSEFKTFFESDKTNDIINMFLSLQENSNDIKKNTSLIVYIETGNIESFFKEYKNLIFKIEEDEYFFRKYVIVYSQSGIQNIITQDNINEKIQEILITNNRIDKFQKDYYKDEEFFIAIQLIIKIPFLLFENKTEKFESVHSKIIEAIEAGRLTEPLELIESFQGNIKTKDYFDKLEEAFLLEDDDNEILIDFFSQVVVNNDEN